MKIKNTKNTKKIVIISSIVVIILAAAAASTYFLTQNNSEESTKNTSNAAKTSNSNKQQTEEINENPEYKETKTNTDTPSPVITDESTGEKTVQMVASADISGGILYIRGGINNSVEFNGTCYAQLIGPNSESVRKDTTLLQNATTTDCKTIQISTSELINGTWKITLNYSSTDTEGASSEISIKIN